jgi:hypothetical protein
MRVCVHRWSHTRAYKRASIPTCSCVSCVRVNVRISESCTDTRARTHAPKHVAGEGRGEGGGEEAGKAGASAALRHHPDKNLDGPQRDDKQIDR